MYAVELCFAIDAGSVGPSAEAVEASIRHNGRHAAARIEHLQVRRIAGEMYAVAFVAAATAQDAKGLAMATGQRAAAELRHMFFSGFRIWTDDQFDRKEQWHDQP